MKISRKKFLVVGLGLMIIFINCSILSRDIASLSEGWEFRSAITTVVLIAYSLIAWKVMGFRFSSPKFFVLFSLYMFHLSSITVIGFDRATEYDYMQMLYRYGESWGFLGTLYSELFIEFYVLGVVIFSAKDSKINYYDRTKVASENSLIICRKIGLIMLAISIFPQLYHDVIQISAKAMGGYQAMFEADTSFLGIPLGWFTKLFLPSILLILSSYRNHKKQFIMVMGMTSVYFLIFMFLTGRKGNTIQTLVPFVFMYCYFFRPKFKLWYIPVIYFGALWVTIVTHTRELAFDASFMSSLSNVISSSNPLKDLCLEMGGTVKAPIQAIMSVPATGNFQWGRTYLVSIIYSILSGIKIPCSELEKYALFNIYLSQPERGSYINSTVYAMGGSAIAEWYWNFGWIGIPLVLIFAFLITKFEAKILKSAYNPIKFAVWTTFLYYLMRYTRGYFNEIVWQPLYILIFVFILQKILLRKRNRAGLSNQGIKEVRVIDDK